MTFLGVDPGAGRTTPGAMVALNESGDVRATVLLSEDLLVIWRFVNEHDGMVACCKVEYISTAIFGTSKSAMSKLYGSYMTCRAMLTAAGIMYEIVKPAAWQDHHGIRKNKGEPTTHWKTRLLTRAKERFPRQGLTKATCDAALIALYGLETYGG